MAKFEITFSRPVVSRDVCKRVIEAATREEAEAKAGSMASAYDQDCPDDATDDGSEECGDWDWDGIEDAPDDAVVDEEDSE